MNSVRQRFFLISATLGAFAVGTLAGAVLTFGPGAEARLAAGSATADLEPATPIDSQRIVLAAELRGEAEPRGFGQIALTDGHPGIAPALGSRIGGQAAITPEVFGPPTPDALGSVGDVGLGNSFIAETPAIETQAPGMAGDAEMAAIATIAKAALTPRPWKSRRVEVRKGDSLTTILKRAGIDGRQVHSALRSLKGVYDPRGLRAGQELVVTAAAENDEPAKLLSIALDLNFDHQLLITRDADGAFTTKTIEQAKRRQLMHGAGDIKDSLYLSARRAAVPNDVTDRLIRLFSWDVDFQRDIRRGDRFETLYDEVTLEKDESQVKGELVYAGLTLRGRLIDAYLFSPDGDRPAYYDRNGRSLRKFLLRTPIDGARLSSHFGKRRHPVLGYTKMHKGTDFAAPRGTPIYAGGSGRIERADRFGTFGNYVRIQHSDTWSTAYAHLHKFGPGIKAGSRVRQGQVIGYVGTTGRSTGPHLHYEVLKNGRQVNPMKMKQPPATQLKGAELAAFEKERNRIDAMREQLSRERRIASRTTARAE